MKNQLERRLLYLYSGESLATVLFILVSYYANDIYPNLKLYSLFSFWASFFLLEFLLLQGTIYWFTKWKRLRNENTSVTPTKLVRQLYRLKSVNIIFIVLPIIAFILDLNRWSNELPKGGLYIAMFIYIFSILEYINYFYIQLSYDNRSDIQYLLKHKKLKVASIRRDFKRIL